LFIIVLYTVSGGDFSLFLVVTSLPELRLEIRQDGKCAVIFIDKTCQRHPSLKKNV